MGSLYGIVKNALHKYSTKNDDLSEASPGYALPPFAIGKTLDSSTITLDLNLIPHTFIGGLESSGKASLMDVLIAQANASSIINVTLCSSVASAKELEPVSNSTVIVNNLEVFEATLEELWLKLLARVELMETLGVSKFRELKSPDNFELIFIHEAAYFLFEDVEELNPFALARHEIAQEHFVKLVKFGGQLGFYFIVSAKTLDDDLMPGHCKANFDARIIMGSPYFENAKTILRVNPLIDETQFQNASRGIVELRGNQKVFQLET